jgi:hypothetical protein
MVIAANMAFANIKGVARDPKDYEVYKKTLYTDNDEKRMDVIGQNGNDGLHYKEESVEKEVIIEKKDEKLLQGNLTKSLPKDEKPKKTTNKVPPNPWGAPGGRKII